jgi:hypothetical protein
MLCTLPCYSIAPEALGVKNIVTATEQAPFVYVWDIAIPAQDKISR